MNEWQRDTLKPTISINIFNTLSNFQFNTTFYMFTVANLVLSTRWKIKNYLIID